MTDAETLMRRFASAVLAVSRVPLGDELERANAELVESREEVLRLLRDAQPDTDETIENLTRQLWEAKYALAKVKEALNVARAGRAEAERENKRLDRELVAALAGQIANVVRREEANAYGDAEHARAEALATRLKGEVLPDVCASLAAAISLLERTPKAKKAAPSDTMFEMMLSDYRASLDRARSTITTEGSDRG